MSAHRQKRDFQGIIIPFRLTLPGHLPVLTIAAGFDRKPCTGFCGEDQGQAAAPALPVGGSFKGPEYRFPFDRILCAAFPKPTCCIKQPERAAV